MLYYKTSINYTSRKFTSFDILKPKEIHYLQFKLFTPIRDIKHSKIDINKQLYITELFQVHKNYTYHPQYMLDDNFYIQVNASFQNILSKQGNQFSLLPSPQPPKPPLPSLFITLAKGLNLCWSNHKKKLLVGNFLFLFFNEILLLASN